MDKQRTAVEHKEVSFCEAELTAVRADDGQSDVSVRHMCDAGGLQRPQRQPDRIKRDVVLNDGLRKVPIRGTCGRQKTDARRADPVPRGLTGLEASRAVQ